MSGTSQYCRDLPETHTGHHAQRYGDASQAFITPLTSIHLATMVLSHVHMTSKAQQQRFQNNSCIMSEGN
jgi:hypothetical protein